MNPLLLIARGVVRETLRRQEFHLVAIMGGLLLLMSIVARLVGIGNPATGTLVLNLGMTLAWYAALVFTLLTVSGILPRELEHRTVYLLLARPITRAQFFLGKWLAGVGLGAAAYFLLMMIAWIPMPRMELYSAAMMAQTLAFGFLGIGLLATITSALSLLMPQPVTIVVAGLLVAVGETAAGMARSLARGGAFQNVVDWAGSYVPAFSRLNTITRYTDGIGPLAAGDFLALVGHVVLLGGFFLALGVVVFHRRAL